jgi:hypothetical protein
MRTFRPRWDRLGLLQDTTVRRPPPDPTDLRAADHFRAVQADQLRGGVNGLYFLARIVLVVPVAALFAIEWIASTVGRGVAAVLNRLH